MTLNYKIINKIHQAGSEEKKTLPRNTCRNHRQKAQAISATLKPVKSISVWKHWLILQMLLKFRQMSCSLSTLNSDMR